MPIFHRYRSLTVTAALAVCPVIAAAQFPDTAHSTAAPEKLFTDRDARIAAAFALGTVLMFPVDRHFAQVTQLEDPQSSRIINNTATSVEMIASPGAYFIGGGLYLTGRLLHSERITDLGWHGTEAVLLAEGTTWALKSLAGRARPFVTADTSPHDFKLLAGLGSEERRSFPSGHTATAFAAAAAVTQEAVNAWGPGAKWIVGPLMYGGASAVGLSRMYHNRHWASDVVLGAAIGTFSGQKVVVYAHRHPHNSLDRVMLHASVAPIPHGLALGWSY